jgi:ABC-type ATPase involved in cell division
VFLVTTMVHISLEKSAIPLTSTVNIDDCTKLASKAYDYVFDGNSKFYPWELPKELPKFNLLVIVGSSGSGKSSLLSKFGTEENPEWQNDKAIISQFGEPDAAFNLLSAVGLNSIPTWTRPFHVLSNGEKFRANLARKIKSGAVIDEFSSVVDREVAKSASLSLRRYINNNKLSDVVISTCHSDILHFLEPDIVIDTDKGTLRTFFHRGQNQNSQFTEHLNLYSGPCLKTIII